MTAGRLYRVAADSALGVLAKSKGREHQICAWRLSARMNVADPFFFYARLRSN